MVEEETFRNIFEIKNLTINIVKTKCGNEKNIFGNKYIQNMNEGIKYLKTEYLNVE